MRRLAVAALALLLPAITAGEVLYLKDGSAIQGSLVRVVGDTLFFRTSFGAELPIAKDKVTRLDFGDVPVVTTTPGPTDAVPLESAVPGTLMVSFDDVKVTSRVVVHRGNDEKALLRANSIECALYVGAQKKYSAIDSVADKTVREGPKTTYKNDMSPEDFMVAVEPGSHRCRIILSNLVQNDSEEKAFEGGPLDKRLLIEGVEVLPGRITLLTVGIKRKMKVGSPQLVLIQ
jgi:hypothetical protein